MSLVNTIEEKRIIDRQKLTTNHSFNKEVEQMKRKELMLEMKEKDLVVLKDQNADVHLVWSDSKRNSSICRPKMLEVGTKSRDEREWEIIGSVDNYSDFPEAVIKLGKTPCRHCIKFCPFV